MANLKMPLIEAVMTSIVGIITVLIILSVIAVLIILVSKVIRAIETAVSKGETEKETDTKPSGIPMPDKMNNGNVELINTDEKTAAVIMAIVSQKSGIPLNRLSFKSIKQKEDKENGIN